MSQYSEFIGKGIASRESSFLTALDSTVSKLSSTLRANTSYRHAFGCLITAQMLTEWTTAEGKYAQ